MRVALHQIKDIANGMRRIKQAAFDALICSCMGEDKGSYFTKNRGKTFADLLKELHSNNME